MTQEILHYEKAYSVGEIVSWMQDLTKNKEKGVRIVSFQIIEFDSYYDDDRRTERPCFDGVVLAEIADFPLSWEKSAAEIIYGNEVYKDIFNVD